MLAQPPTTPTPNNKECSVPSESSTRDLPCQALAAPLPSAHLTTHHLLVPLQRLVHVLQLLHRSPELCQCQRFLPPYPFLWAGAPA